MSEENSNFILKKRHILGFSIVPIGFNLIEALLGEVFLKFITDIVHMDILYYSLAMILHATFKTINKAIKF